MLNPSDSFARALYPTMVKPKIFVSYHHANDQFWYSRFSELFNSRFEIFTDNSVKREIESNTATYLRRAIREKNITGTSVTVVLCGLETWKRRWVDWEIQMTLNKEHGLLGIVLPAPYCAKNLNGECVVPDRLLDNIGSGFARWMHWNTDPTTVYNAIIAARDCSAQTGLIRNSAPAMQRSLS